MLCLATPALAQGEREVRAWLDSQVAAALTWPTDQLIDIKYRVEFHCTMTPEELSALEARVRGKRDHPDRPTLQTQLSRRAAPEVSSYRLITDGKDRWRIGNYGEKSRIYLDAAVADSQAWTLTGTDVATLSPDSRGAGAVRSQRDSHRRTVLDMASRRLADIAAYGLQERVVTKTADGWRVDAANPEHKVLVRYSLKGQANPTVTSVEILQAPNPEMVGERAEFEGEVLTPDGRSLAKLMRVWRRGMVAEVTMIDSIEAIDEAKLERAIAIPERGAPDELRGLVKVSRVTKWEGDEQAVQEFDQQGQLLSPRTGRNQTASWFNLVGWAAAALGVGVIVVLARRLIMSKTG